ncbi:MAG: hypothetical protein LDL33_02165 [Desulfomonile sp.]|nr:hypothetical protein [Desulfomonile sp.]
MSLINTISFMTRSEDTAMYGECSSRRMTAQGAKKAQLCMTVRRFGALFALIGALVLWAACIPAPAAEPGLGVAPTSSGLIKPVIPQDAGETESPVRPAFSAPAAREVASLQRGSDSGQHSWEDEKVKSAALHIAKTVPNVRKIQMCYAVEEDEWWVSLYDDIGLAVDVKQFVWNRELEILEPFLVQKRIPRGQLDEHLSRKTPDRACEVIDLRSPGASR